MADKSFNLCRFTTATTGTGPIVVGAAVVGFFTPAAAGAVNGDVGTYSIQDGANSETGRGTYSSTGPTLTRTTVFLSSAGSGTPISLSGAAQVMFTPLAQNITLSGGLTTNKLAKASSATGLVDSLISDDGATITVGGLLTTTVSGVVPSVPPTAFSANVTYSPTSNNTSGLAIGSSSIGATSGSFNIFQIAGSYTYYQHGSSGTLTAGVGLLVDSNTNIGGGSITSNYGLYIEPQTAGAVNFAIFTNSGRVRFGDGVVIGAPSGGYLGSGTLNIQGDIFNSGASPSGTGGYVRITSPTIETPTINVPYIATPTLLGGTVTATAGNFTIDASPGGNGLVVQDSTAGPTGRVPMVWLGESSGNYKLYSLNFGYYQFSSGPWTGLIDAVAGGVSTGTNLEINPSGGSVAIGGATTIGTGLEVHSVTGGPYPTAAYPGGNNIYFVGDKGATGADFSIVMRDQGNARAEFGLVGDNNVHLKVVRGTYPSESFIDRIILYNATSQVQMFSLGAEDMELSINEQAGGQKAYIDFLSMTINKWGFGKAADNSFFLYDYANASNVIYVGTGGGLQLGETGAGVEIGSPTGGTPGTGSLNVAGSVYDNGTIPTGTAGSGYVRKINPTITNPNIVGTATNDNAAAGGIGEYISSNIPLASAVTLTSTTTANVTSISLTAGDWDVRGAVSFNPAGTTTTSEMRGGISLTSATFEVFSDTRPRVIYDGAPGAGLGGTLSLATARISLASTTTVYLITQATFAVSTNAAFGWISARRMR